MSTDVVRTAARDVIRAYEHHNPIRTADFHRSECACLRCAIDNLAAALAHDAPDSAKQDTPS